MKKFYLSTKVLAVLMMFALLLPQAAKAQCGLAAFATPAGALNPTSAWQNVVVGSGTYATFNVTNGNIYSFRYTTTSSAGYSWDMTLSNTSTALPYNNSTTPLRDPWTGGICSGVSSPQSADWFSTFNGTIRINTKAYNGACFDYVPGMGSATLQYKVCAPVGDPGSGSNSWNVEAFATADIAIPNTNARWGYYTDNNLNFASTNFWGNTLNPGVASTWVGCTMPNDMFTVRARRTNFPCNYYQLFLNNADDDVRVYVNNVQIYSAACCASNVNLGNYVLGTGDNVEVRFTGVCGGDNVSLAFNPVSLPAVNGGTIGGVTNGASICEGQPVGLFTNVTSGSGGTAGLTNGGSVTYDWEFSTNGGATYTSAGVNTPTWNVTSPVPVGGVYAFRRKTIDRCGNSAYSNVIIVNGRSTPNGSFAPANQTICPGTSANVTLNFSPGTAPFNVVYSDGVTNTTLTGISNGSSITLSPTNTTNYNFVSITDGYGCSRTSGFTGGAQIAVQPTISINSISVTNVNCNGGNDGVISISASGGVSPLQYSINNGGSYQLSNTFSGLTAGNYNVVVKDAFNCSKANGSVTVVTQPTALTHTTSKADASCGNVSDGSITVTPGGGTAPYLYSINGGPTQSGNQFTNLAAGTYTIRVFDAHNCVSLSSVTINNSYAVTGSIISQTNVSCFGGANGSISVQLNGGIPPYQYSFNGGSFSGTSTFNGLSIGTYTIVMRDSHGCIDTKSTTITQPTLLTVAVDSVVNANCFGTSTGGVYITPAGGTTPYTYAWSNGATTQDDVNVPIGTYSVTITDNLGCTTTASGTVSQPSLLVPTITSYHDLNCFQDLSGSIDLSVSGSVAPYTYLWSNGATTQDISGLAIGTYAVTVTDAHNCTAGISQLISQPTDVVHTTDTVAASCSNVFDGKITINAGGGISPYQYSLNGGPTQAGNQFTGLGAGTYTVYVYDAHGCADSSTAVINNSYAVTGSITNQTNVSCFGGADGALTVQLSGGIPPYLYSLNGGSYTTTNIFTGLTAGVYVIGMRDSKGCNDFKSVTITQPAQLTIVIDSVVNATCNGATTGGVYINVVGGTPFNGLYSYNWSNGATTQDNVNVGAGTYLVTVTDNNGCTTTGGATVTQPLLLVGAVANFHNLNCFNDGTGSIDISISGGVPPYTYNWSNGASTEDINSVGAGSYSVTVNDANNCSVVLNQTLTEPTQLSGSVSGTNLSCFNNASGSIDLTPAGGTTPYTFYWNTGATTEDISALSAGTYTVIITDAHGCTATNAITISQPAQLVLSGVVSNIACNGATSGGIDLTATGGTGAISFAWSTGATTEDVSGLNAGTYSVTATDVNACSATASFTITQPAALALSVTSYSDVNCNGGNNGFINVNTLGGVANYTYLWSNGQTTEDVTGLIAGTYTLTVTDANGCTATISQVISEPTLLQASVTTGTITCNGGTTNIDLTATGGTLNYSYFWNNGATVEDLNNVGPGTYTVLVTDAHNCTATASATITQPTAIVVSGVVTNVSCFAGNDGAIDFTANGGTGALGFAWSNGATTEDISGLTAGTYSVTVTDVNSCSASASFTVTQPALLVASVVSSGDVNCNGGTNGFINVAVTGGVTNYTYAWSNGATIEDLVNIPAGTYTLTVTDAHGCTATTNQTISEPAALTASITTGTITCNGGTTNADLSVGGGTTPYTFFWNNGATTEDLAVVGAGTYTVAVTDAHGCTATATTTITQPTGISLSGVATNVSCFGGTDGAVDITAAGGTGTLTFAWSNGATTEDITSLAAGAYSVTVTDVNGCSTSASFNVTQPALLTATVVSSGDVSCNGGTNGFINVAVTGGVTNYTYAWSNGATIEDLVNIPAGTYTLTVTDAHGCTATASQIINEPAQLTASASAGTIACFGGTTNVTLTVNGGTTNYAYFWNNGATTQNLTGVGAGTYTVVVTDAHNCTATASVTITQPSGVTLSGVVTNVNCFGGTDGAIDITAAGGTGTLTFAWSNGAVTEDLSGLAAGSYSVTVTDANGCSISASYTVTQPSLLTATVVSSGNVNCNGGSNGFINVTVTGGVTNYTYSWSNGATIEDLVNIPAGTYTLTVTDAHGCTATASQTITEPAQLTASASAGTISCYGGTTSVTLTVGGGTTNYTYFWNNGATTQNLSNVGPGTYTVLVTDANACTATASVSITQPAAIVVSGVATNVSCFNGNNGAVDLTATGGTGTLTFAWSNGSTNEDQTGLTVGSYDVTVTDGNGCTATAGFVITQPASSVTVTAVATDVTCNGAANGSVNATVGGGTFGYTYLWSNGATTEDITGLAPNAYTITVTDGNGCTASASATVSEPAALIATIAGTDVTCFGGTNGSADLTVTGGNSPYTYFWSTFEFTEDISNLSAGTYSVIVTDTKSCSAIASVTISQPAQLVITATVNNVSCNGSTDGAIDITVTGGTGAGTYSYQWNTAATTEDLTNLAAGTYTVTVIDNNGCTATASYTVTQPAPIVITGAPTTISCNGGTTTIDITVTGGTTPYTYSWSNGATTQDLTNVPAGAYGVEVTDANFCTATAFYNVTQPAALVSSYVATNVSCFGASNGSIDETVSGGTAPYTFLWNTFNTTEDLNNIGGGTYFVIITDANGCKKTDSIVITEPTALQLSVSATNILCNGGTGAVDLTVSGGTLSYSFAWSNGDVTEDLAAVGPGSYTVTVTDGNGCTATASATVTQPAAISAVIASYNDVSCFGANNGNINISVTGGVTPYTFAWSNGNLTEDLVNIGPGTYTVTITDANACTATLTQTITEPAAMTAAATATTIACFGGTADVDLTVTGGSTPYTYFWNNGSLTEDLTGVSAGTYGVMVTDAHGCTANASVTITQPTALQVSVAVTNVLCNGGTGLIDLTVSGATPNYTFAWSNGAATEDISAVAGTYTVTVTDANGCTATATGIITQPSALSMVAQTVNVSCNGGSNGFINITVSGGVFPYSYDWGGGNTQEDQYSIAAGTYTVTATDANGCTISQSYTITEPAAITSSIVTTDVTCAGANNGAADLTVSGGTAPYSFSWSNFKVSEDLTGIAGGTYYVIITDANGCTHRDSAVINEPTPLVLTTVVTNISCSGNNSGAVDLTVTGGTLNYSFAWSNGAFTEDISGLAQGIYTVTVTDGNGCTATASGTVTQPNALVVVAAIQDVTCAGDNNGAINITVSGGSLPYSFNWSNNAITEDLVNLLAGTYDVTITDNNGCSVTGSYAVNEPAAMTSNVVGTNVLCQGANNGTADLTVTGGTPPYTFLWSNFQGSEDVSNLDGGIYYVLITDASGCTHRDSVIILEPSPLILSTVVVNVSCNNANDGTIDLTVQGGTSNYSYAWSSGQNTQDLSGLAGGTYVVTVTDFNGCTAVSSNTVVNPSPIAANFISHRPLCYGDANGSIDMIPTGGTPPFVFAWSNGANTEDVTGLVAATYFITITDSRGCVKTDSVVITEPDPLVTSGFIKNVSCAGFKDGFLDITGYGGTLPYTFQWNTLQSTEDIGNLSGGNYYVTVTDANLCQVASLYVVSEPDTLKLELFGTNVSCNGGNNGTAFAVYSGGTTPYQFLWEDFTTGPIRTGLSAGYYAIMLTDSNGCFALDSITLTAPTAIAITGTTTNVLCNGAATGAIDITVTGGTGTYTFVWSNAATTEDVTGLVAGVYTVTVTDASGCTATASFTITEPLPIALNTIFTNPGCHGGTNGSISVIALQGVAPYTYSWNTTPVQTTASAQALNAGTYTVTVTDSKGCTASISQTLNQPDSIVVTTDSHAAKCFNTASGYVVADVAGGQTPYVYELNGFAQASDTFTNLLPGNYIILVTDVNGCEGTATFNIPQASQISVDLGVTQQVIATGMNTQLVATANSTSPILNYFWTPDSLFDFSACGDPLNCNNPLVHPATTTLFTVMVMNSDSCYASDTISVFVSSSLSYFISTAFTPNGDGLNDRFQFDVLGADNLEIDIFNRWGQRFYHDDNQTNGFGNSDGWDGTYNGKPAPEDTYVYKLTITYFDNTTREIEGTVTLMR